MNDLVEEIGKFKTWEQINREFKIDKNLYFRWTQLVHASTCACNNKLLEKRLRIYNKQPKSNAI